MCTCGIDHLGSSFDRPAKLERAGEPGHTFGMKTAVSIPDEVFEQADTLARRIGVSRSQLVSEALREYVARHAPDDVAEAMDRVADAIGAGDNAFAAASARRILKQSEW